MEARKFETLGELLEHLREEIAAAEDTPSRPEVDLDDEIVISDFDLRRATVKAVIDHIGFSSPEEFAKYVEFIYGFVTASTD